jgi:thymidylate kinase
VSVPTELTDSLVAEFDRVQLARNGMPDDAVRADRRRCLELLTQLLGDDAGPDRIRTSALGVEWTEVFDVHARRPLDPDRLAALGWLPLDRLLGARSRGRAAPRRWAVVEDGRVLAGVRLVEHPDDPVRSVLQRCRERSEVRLADVLELCELRRRDEQFPVDAAELRAAAQIESGLGGRLLAPWASGFSASAPAELSGRRRGLVLAISGVDGSGKSTLRAALADGLERAGVPVSTVWVRPGMGLGRLIAVAAWGKRLLRQDARPGLRAMADPGAAKPASRKGAVGWLWAFLVTLSFLSGVWRQHLRARGVVLYDRHLVDALATLDFAYAGVDLRLQRALVRAFLPRAAVRVYLDVPAEVSVARKPDDLLGEHAIRRQLDEYARWLDRVPPSLRLDATRSTGDLVAEVLQFTATEGP